MVIVFSSANSLSIMMNRVNACRKKVRSSENRKKAKENVQKNASVVAKMPKLPNYFTKQVASDKYTSL